MKLTADTITDDQIRELRECAVVRFERGVDMAEDRQAAEWARLALVPQILWPTLSDVDRDHVHRARARCAEILNARRK